MTYGSSYHVPVMVAEVLDALQPQRGGLFLDGTLGGGGHAEALLEAGPGARLVGVDQDPDAIAAAAQRLSRFGARARLVRSNFADAIEAAGLGPGSLDGVLLDLGISSHQIDDDARGFTFRPGAPLDMRMMGPGAANASAADLLNELDEAELARIFREYGEEPRARRLARAVVEARAAAPFERSEQLLDVLHRVLGPRAEVQDRARVFQALRIATNRELDVLREALPRFRDALTPGGVLAVLSYHSLEDRIVKDLFREWSQTCVCPPRLPICVCRGAPLGVTLTRKPLPASPAEVGRNARARSARLRAWRRL
jgi:16S rRNA (cytosine1402-N4)-methyltransferase